ncbi:hypothetical protein DVS28_b0145 (plasmid) [Euzebya pacifica]|uniref:Uncharacterized protein n=1 Tax=Euzebya pacifica TaxID=1608957 RepID=A0A346Y618_9ACTN|nr:hypothetical protein DVS28_b0145 [Euzebya pacifica]
MRKSARPHRALGLPNRSRQPADPQNLRTSPRAGGGDPWFGDDDDDAGSLSPRRRGRSPQAVALARARTLPRAGGAIL